MLQFSASISRTCVATAARRIRKGRQLTKTRAVLASCLYSADLAVQRQAVHADVPPYPGPASAVLSAHGAPWAPTSHASRDVRGGPRCASGAWWIRVCVPAILPRTGAFILTGWMVGSPRLTVREQMMQPMMPGMPPPPPGYMPGPYMQHMPYPMPPPNGELSWAYGDKTSGLT